MFDGRDHTHAGAGLDCPDCHGPIDPEHRDPHIHLFGHLTDRRTRAAHDAGAVISKSAKCRCDTIGDRCGAQLRRISQQLLVDDAERPS